MSILVLGSEGVIGKSLCTELIKNGYIVKRWDIKISPHHDLSNFKNLQLLKEAVNESDFVFFLAYDVGGSKYILNSGITFINNNILIMLNTFNVLDKKKFIFTSSTMYNMSHVYGTLKHLGEKYTSKLGGLSVRLWNVYGSEKSSDKSHVIADMIHSYKTKGYIDLMTSGDEKRQFLHSDDCAKALIALMINYHRVLEKESIIDVTNFYWTSIKELAKIICDDVRVTDVKVSTHDRQNEPSKFILNYWKPTISLASGVTSLLLND